MLQLQGPVDFFWIFFEINESQLGDVLSFHRHRKESIFLISSDGNAGFRHRQQIPYFLLILLVLPERDELKSAEENDESDSQNPDQ